MNQQRSGWRVACLSLAMVALCGPLLAGAAASSVGANHRADPLLSVDMNRAEIVDRLMTQWQGEFAAGQRDSFKQKLAGLRADRLLAVSLVGSFDGVLKVLYGQEQSNNALATLSALASNKGSADRQKALGDADRDLVYTPLSPCRLFDTRTGQPSALGQLGGTFAPNTGRNIVPAGACAIPASAVKNLFVSLTTLNNTPGSGGYITLLAPSAPVTTTTDIFNLNSQWSAANSIVTTGTAGQFVVYVATANAEVVVDVLGYFAPPPQPIGDITEVNTGTAATTGLSGGATSGIATLTLAPTFKLPQSCANGQVPKFNTSNSLWQCQNDTVGGSGTVTSVATGAGLTGGPITGSGTVNLAATQLLPTVACASGQIAKWSGSAWICAADDAGPANAFVQGGNTFSALGAGVASVLGNNDNRPLTVQAPQSTIKLLVDPANGDAGLRITYATDGASFEPTITPNTINGSRANTVAAGVIGATIGGGGVSSSLLPAPNEVNAAFGTVSGGRGNTVTGVNAVVAGGTANTAGAVGKVFQTVGGGSSNTASGTGSTVPGGRQNTAAGDFSFAAGLNAQANHDGAFVWGDNTAGSFATSTGVNQFVIRANGGIRLLGAGENQPGNPLKQSGTNMFTHVVPTTGPCQAAGVASRRTAIDHPLTNGNANAILVVTSLGSVSGGASVFPEPVAVYYEPAAAPGGCPADRWVIFSLGSTAMTAAQRFNVFVINP